jgi:hypothetical protein
LGQPRDLGGVVYLFGTTGHEDAPTRVVRAVDVVAFERDVTLAGGKELGSLVGPEHHRGVVEREVRREHERLRVENNGEAAKPAATQQPRHS